MLSVAVLVVLGWIGGVGALGGPVVPPQFTSTIVLTTVNAELNGTMYYDRTGGRLRITTNTKAPYAPAEYVGTPAEWVNSTSWIVKDGEFYSINDSPHLIKNTEKFEDMFAWTPYATSHGNTTVKGVPCTMWEFTYSGNTLAMCADGNRPVMFKTKQNNMGITYYFGEDFRPTVDPSVFVGLDEKAARNPPPCDGEEKVVNQTVYIFHPEHEFNISGQNVADAVGDTVFVCYDNGTLDHYAWVSTYVLEMNTKWGQYRPCNGYPSVCLGANHFYVGHEATFGLSAHNAGQCSDNTLTGNWYSLPVAGECPPGESVRAGGPCTWRTVERVKTIDAKCLRERSFTESCLAEMRLPLPKSTALFVSAFKPTAEGGCPAINP